MMKKGEENTLYIPNFDSRSILEDRCVNPQKHQKKTNQAKEKKKTGKDCLFGTTG